MKLTSQNMCYVFSYFNRELFGGKLIVPKLIASKFNPKFRAASFSYDTEKRDIKIYVFSEKDMEENEWMEYLLHEMIHYVLYLKYLHPFIGQTKICDDLDYKIDHTIEFKEIFRTKLKKVYNQIYS